MKPDRHIKYLQLSSARIAYRLFGSDIQAPLIVIETGLGSLGAEWWHLAQKLGENYRVLVYDRAGYGASSRSKLERAPEKVARELRELIKGLGLNRECILAAHGLGALYAQQYVRTYPEKVKGLVMVDPWSGKNERFRKNLETKLYDGSGIDRTRGLQVSLLLSLLPLYPLTRRLLFNAPPFFYFNGFLPEAREYMEHYLVRPGSYRTMLKEYSLYRKPSVTAHLADGKGFPPVPLAVLYHQPGFLVKEMMLYGNLSRKEAWKVESLWEENAREYLSFSPESSWTQAEYSGQYLHLTEFHLVEQALARIVSGKKTQE